MWKVNFTYLNKDGMIRTGALVILQAANAEAATKAASDKLAKMPKYPHYKIIAANPY